MDNNVVHPIIYAMPQPPGIYFPCIPPMFINAYEWLIQKYQVLLYIHAQIILSLFVKKYPGD